MEDQHRYNGQYRLVTAWGYIGYTLLYSIPIVGIIFLLIHAFSDRYLCRRNFARSFLCWIVLFILLLMFGVFSGAFGVIIREIKGI